MFVFQSYCTLKVYISFVGKHIWCCIHEYYRILKMILEGIHLTRPLCCRCKTFANANQTNKGTIGGFIGGPKETWQPWQHTKRLAIAEKVGKLKKRLKDLMGKQRSRITKIIAQNKSRQEFVPPSGKYVDLLKAEPLHNTNNAWQNWFSAALSVVM